MRTAGRGCVVGGGVPPEPLPSVLLPGPPIVGGSYSVMAMAPVSEDLACGAALARGLLRTGAWRGDGCRSEAAQEEEGLESSKPLALAARPPRCHAAVDIGVPAQLPLLHGRSAGPRVLSPAHSVCCGTSAIVDVASRNKAGRRGGRCRSPAAGKGWPRSQGAIGIAKKSSSTRGACADKVRSVLLPFGCRVWFWLLCTQAKAAEGGGGGQGTIWGGVAVRHVLARPCLHSVGHHQAVVVPALMLMRRALVVGAHAASLCGRAGFGCLGFRRGVADGAICADRSL